MYHPGWRLGHLFQMQRGVEASAVPPLLVLRRLSNGVRPSLSLGWKLRHQIADEDFPPPTVPYAYHASSLSSPHLPHSDAPHVSRLESLST